MLSYLGEHSVSTVSSDILLISVITICLSTIIRAQVDLRMEQI